MWLCGVGGVTARHPSGVVRVVDLDASVLCHPRRYSRPPASYDAAYAAVRQALTGAFYGPPKGGVFSPSVQVGCLCSLPSCPQA